MHLQERRTWRLVDPLADSLTLANAPTPRRIRSLNWIGVDPPDRTRVARKSRPSNDLLLTSDASSSRILRSDLSVH
jgi:hypothetical protein